MAPKRKESPPEQIGPIPTRWSVKTEIKKDGSKVTIYYCPDSGQNFLSYANMIRYVEYAKRRRLGIYSPSFKAVKKTQNDAKKKSTAKTIPRKTSAILSLRGRPVPADQNNDSKSSRSDGNRDEDYVPKRDAGVPARLGIDIAGKVLIAKNKKRVD